ncbi:T9SS type A sorting domain-containing protein [Telluribacter humicola]|uniref:T9SS type A sorting domain-containing protein n=1 Tax=Telluribacter humicola TaxID=1720261 RepID=UPI001A973D9F|nr:T9SS type A sorting domain-containing protein [Telluribacter humicola]
MKQTLLIAYIVFTAAIAQAQTTATRSRLDMAYKKQPAGLDRPTLVRQPAVIEYKPLALPKHNALNDYYRSLMFANPSAAQLATPREAAPVVAQVDRSERRGYGFEDKERVEEKLYSSDRITVSNIYPNPANESAEIDYTLSSSVRDAKLIIYNVLGSPVAEFSLDKNDTKLNVNTRELPTGIYFYQLAVEGKKVATKKMLVRHQQ